MVGQHRQVGRRADAEPAHDHLEREQAAALVGELVGQIRGRAAGERGGLVGPVGEDQRVDERVRHQRPHAGIGERLVRLLEVLDGGRALGQHLGETELGQQLGPPGGRRGLLQRPPQDRDAALRRPAPDGHARGVAQLPGDPLLPAARRPQQVRRHVLGRRARLAQHARGVLVLELALAQRQLLVDGVAHERVDEAQRRFRPQDLGPRERAGGVGHARLVEPGQGGDGGQRGALGQDGDRAGDGDRVRRQPREPDDHRARDRARADLEHHAGVRGVGPHAVGLERGQQLAQIERVAARRRVAGSAKGLLGLRPEPLAHERAHGVGAQRDGADRDRGRVVGDLAQQRHVGPGLVRAHGGGHEDRLVLEPARKVGEKAQRRPVAPVQVVDRQQQRPLGGQVERDPVQAVQRREGHVALALQRAEHRRGGRRGAAQQLLAAGDDALEQLAHDAERELALELGAAGAEHERAAVGRPPARLGEQRALADPGRTLDEHGPALARRRRVDQREQLCDLTLALDEFRHEGVILCGPRPPPAPVRGRGPPARAGPAAPRRRSAGRGGRRARRPP